MFILLLAEIEETDEDKEELVGPPLPEPSNTTTNESTTVQKSTVREWDIGKPGELMTSSVC